MLNTEKFIKLAGDTEQWDKEMADVPKNGEYYQSDPLCKLQVSQSARGFRAAHLVLSVRGWTVRYASGIQNFGILRLSDSFDPASALEWATKWVNRDPKSRELYVSKSEVFNAERDGHDCSALRAFE